MNKKDICVVIPIYKEVLDEFEIKSIEQCVKFLSDYSIHFVCTKELCIDFYIKNFPKIKNFNFFETHYFTSIEGYNRLLLSSCFYKVFIAYNYMLIYQTDCFVFRDELLDWSNKGYDYIGGIWFDNCIGNPETGAKIWQAGNGGLSLRNIKAVINLLDSKKRVKNFSQLVNDKVELFKKSKINFLKSVVFLPLNSFGYKNNYNYKAKKYKFNEDYFFIECSLELKNFKVPLVNEALLFSWDRCPKFLYSRIGKLPFACHAWFREDSVYLGNKNFWINDIKLFQK